MASSITDVAERAQVSVATVSRVLNHNPRVKPQLREAVLKAMRDLDYNPSGIAQSMRSQSGRVIGLIISDIQNPFFTALVRAVEDVAYANSYRLLLCNSDEQPAKEDMYIGVLARERVAGSIIVPAGPSRCETLSNRRMPIVIVDRRIAELALDQVVLDNVVGARAATEHLIALGHRRIALISAPLTSSVGNERRQGYESALRAHGIALDPTLVQIGDFKEAGGYAAAQQLLALSPRPTALFATNNLMTLGALRAIHERGLNIPGDISVVGFDDMPWLSLLTPPLTTVCQPTYEIGSQAAHLLLKRMLDDRHAPPRLVVLQPALIVRESTAAPREHLARAAVHVA